MSRGDALDPNRAQSGDQQPALRAMFAWLTVFHPVTYASDCTTVVAVCSALFPGCTNHSRLYESGTTGVKVLTGMTETAHSEATQLAPDGDSAPSKDSPPDYSRLPYAAHIDNATTRHERRPIRAMAPLSVSRAISRNSTELLFVVAILPPAGHQSLKTISSRVHRVRHIMAQAVY